MDCLVGLFGLQGYYLHHRPPGHQLIHTSELRALHPATILSRSSRGCDLTDAILEISCASPSGSSSPSHPSARGPPAATPAAAAAAANGLAAGCACAPATLLLLLLDGTVCAPSVLPGCLAAGVAALGKLSCCSCTCGSDPGPCRPRRYLSIPAAANRSSAVLLRPPDSPSSCCSCNRRLLCRFKKGGRGMRDCFAECSAPRFAPVEDPLWLPSAAAELRRLCVRGLVKVLLPAAVPFPDPLPAASVLTRCCVETPAGFRASGAG